jgi:hypothetical protein
MLTCPRCHQNVDRQAIECPYCRTLLKAHGHPGMTLHQAIEGAFLCPTCAYHVDDSCTFPQRPQAITCTLYKNIQRAEEVIPPLPLSRVIQDWVFRHKGLLLLLAVMIGSIALAFINSRR